MRKNLIAMILLSVMLIFGTSVTAFAADGDSGNKDKQPYKYKVFVYAGNQGTFKGVKEWSAEYTEGGDVVTFSVNDVKVNDDVKDKYVVRGFKLAGHDNDETSYSPQITFNGGGDVSYVVSYRIPGDMVAYKVNYVTSDGKALGSDTFYGMVGDKPVVSFKYFEGYLPNVYNQAKTLSRDGDNSFTFTYTKGSGTYGQNANGNGDNGDNANANANGNANNGNANANGNAAAGNNNANGNDIAANAPGTAGNPAGGNTANIGDNSVPLANPDVPQYADLDEENAINWPMILGISGGIVALALLLALFLLKRRKNGQEELTAEQTQEQAEEIFRGLYK